MKIKTCKRCGFQGDCFQISAHECVVKYSGAIQRELERLWFIYGNNGPKCTMDNHKFIQRHVEGRAPEARYFNPTKDCKEAVKRAVATL